MLCGLLYDIWALVCNVAFCMVFGLLCMRAVVLYVGCCMICGLLYDKLCFVWYAVFVSYVGIV